MRWSEFQKLQNDLRVFQMCQMSAQPSEEADRLLDDLVQGLKGLRRFAGEQRTTMWGTYHPLTIAEACYQLVKAFRNEAAQIQASFERRAAASRDPMACQAFLAMALLFSRRVGRLDTALSKKISF